VQIFIRANPPHPRLFSSSQHERGTPQTMKIRRDPLRLCGSA
jgi:hypothetical protein